MKHFKYLIPLFALLILSACADSSVNGPDSSKSIAPKLTINNMGTGSYTVIYVPIDSASQADNKNGQESSATATMTAEPKLALGQNGGTGTLADQGANATLDKVKSVLESATDKSTNTETPTVKPTETKPSEVKPADIKDEPISSSTDVTSDDEAYNSASTYDSYGVRNGRQAWRISKKGTEFGSSIKLVFSDGVNGTDKGKTFVVPDTSKNCRDNQETCRRDKSAEAYGFVFKPGIGPNGEGDSDTGTSHGGVYLQAPWDSKAKKVTIYYNK